MSVSAHTTFSIHHVGGRSGVDAIGIHGEAFSRLDPQLLKFIELSTYDADENCLQEIKSTINDMKVKVYPFCIGREDDTDVDFHIAQDPYASSLFSLNPAFENFQTFFHQEAIGYRLGSSFKAAKTYPVRISSLDRLRKENQIPPVDILSLDVQGAELLVLQGGEKSISKETIGICLEVEFLPLYQDQCLFRDIDKWMDLNGFELLRLTPVHDNPGYYPSSLPVGFFGRERTAYAEAEYVRKNDTVLSTLTDEQSQLQFLTKKALYALLIGQFATCMESLFLIEKQNLLPLLKRNSTTHTVHDLLSRIWKHYQDSPPLYPAEFSRLADFEVCSYRHLSHAEQLSQLEEGKALMDRYMRNRRQYVETLKPYIEDLSHHSIANSTPLENTLRTTGFTKLAATLEKTRKEISQRMLEFYHFPIARPFRLPE